MFYKHFYFIGIVFFLINNTLMAQSKLDDLMPVRSFCISAPKPKEVNRFIQFIEKELVTRSVNTLILRIDFNYEFQTHPELRDSNALTRNDILALTKVCQQYKIQLIPQINLLGHQSWATKTNMLLKVYPEFDETPQVKVPKKYVWPNEDSLYCKSYCPLHEGVHKVVFDLVDEICDVFNSSAFHAGMDEVFFIGDPKCSRCKGKDKAQLYADEVNLIQKHLANRAIKLWIWGDRLLDGRTQGLGMWEGSFNNTHGAIDLISKEVIICDWHYEKPFQTATNFASKGLNVITCSWRNPSVAVTQTQDMMRFRATAEPNNKMFYQGMMQTIWSNVTTFLDEFYSQKEGNTEANCFRKMFLEIKTSAETK